MGRKYIDYPYLRLSLKETCWGKEGLADFLDDCIADYKTSSMESRTKLFASLKGQKIATGSSTAKERLYRIMLPIVLLAIVRKFPEVSGTDLEDIIQDGLVEFENILDAAEQTTYETFVGKCYKVPDVLQHQMEKQFVETVPMNGYYFTFIAPDEIAVEHECRQKLDLALSTLNPKGEFVLRALYGLENGELARDVYSLTAVGQFLGIAPQTVRYIEETALRRMRHPSRSHLLRDYIR